MRQIVHYCHYGKKTTYKNHEDSNASKSGRGGWTQSLAEWKRTSQPWWGLRVHISFLLGLIVTGGRSPCRLGRWPSFCYTSSALEIAGNNIKNDALVESLWSLTQMHSYWTRRDYRERGLGNSTQVVSPIFWYDTVVVERKDERHNIPWSWKNWWGPDGHWHLNHNLGQILDRGTWLVTGMWEGAITLKKEKKKQSHL